MTDSVDTDALRAFGQAMQVEVPDHPFLSEQVINAADEVDRLRAKLDIVGAHDMHLRAVIENAPHESPCPARPPATFTRPMPCTCWKADAL